MNKLNVDINLLKELCEKGLTDWELGEVFNCSYSCIASYRRKLKIPFNPSKKSKFNLTKEELTTYVEEGLTDKEIAERIDTYPPTIKYWRDKFDIKRASFKENPEIPLNNIQKQVLFGTVMGDGYLNQVTNKNSTLEFNHSFSQKEYVDYKYNFFNNFPGRTFSFLRSPHKTTGKRYNTYTAIIHTNKSFNFYREIFYKNGKKVIPIEYLQELYTPLAMAIHYCDDGSCIKNKKYTSYVVSIATCSFRKEDLLKFKDFLANVYNIEVTITGNNRVYITAKSHNTFFELIKEYVPKSMQYKIYDVS